MQEKICCKEIDKHAEELSALAMKIWENPEMGWHEKKASSWTAEYLKSQGFEVELGAYGMPTAVRAVWGKGHPVIGFCGEYDCLPGLSQKACSHQEPVVEGGIGHGCGHNLLGVGCVAACLGLKAELEASGKEGTVIYYGCPAEEQLTGKGFMAKRGAFYECDLTITWHPGTSNQATLGVNNGVQGAIFHFKGKTSHAAGNPWNGRSALDAAQLMNMGVEFLREHVTDDVRMHYQYLDAGKAPNIVPDTAAVKYFVRALTWDSVADAYKRVIKCAEGAAHMTETEVTVESVGGIYPTMQNRVMSDVMQRMREEIPVPEYTEEELKFADEINRTSPLYVEGVTPPIDYEVKPLGNFNGGGSTDYGDVAHICPGVMCPGCTAPTLSGGHSWMITAASGTSIGVKGMLYQAKIMAAGAFEMVKDPALVEAAKKEFEESMGGKKYECPITDEIPWPYDED